MNTEKEIENFIRKEMDKLDIITGISTSDSPIFITDSCKWAGTYCPSTYPDCFSFSKRFFSDIDIDIQILLYIIRHEYAHCMCFRIYGQRGHGWWFKHCCDKIDCYPDESIYDYLRSRTQIYLSDSAFSNDPKQ